MATSSPGSENATNRGAKARGEQTEYQNRFVIPRSVAEAEFKQAGFVIDSKSDFIPFYAMWRVYVLRKI